MRKVLEKNIESAIHSFTVLDLQEPYFDPNWHFHSHYQLFTVLEGTGTRFIGDNIQPFSQGDAVFLGPNIPHLWSSDKDYFDPKSQLKTHGIVLYFTQDFLGETFFQKPEMHALAGLLERSRQGMSFQNEARRQMIQSLQKMTHLEGFDAVLELLHLFSYLAKTTDYELITSVDYFNTHKVSETERMQKVHDYVIRHFREAIRLGEIAAMVNMTEPAFCRYFKKRSNKTFSEFVNEIRVGHACKLLDSQDLSVAQIAYECGFQTLSNFNTQFRRYTGKAPTEYKKRS